RHTSSKRDWSSDVCSSDLLVKTGVPEDRIEIDSIGDYFDSRLYSEQFEGMFAEKIILVEGLTERLSLPIWLEKENYFLSANGVRSEERRVGKESRARRREP